MTDENSDSDSDDEDERDKHAIRGGTEFVEKLYGNDEGEDEDDEGETDE